MPRRDSRDRRSRLPSCRLTGVLSGAFAIWRYTALSAPSPPQSMRLSVRTPLWGRGGVRGPYRPFWPLTPAISPQRYPHRKSRRQWGEGAERDRLPAFLTHTPDIRRLFTGDWSRRASPLESRLQPARGRTTSPEGRVPCQRLFLGYATLPNAAARQEPCPGLMKVWGYGLKLGVFEL